MFIQLKDVNLAQTPKTQNLFILRTCSASPLYPSRSFAGHDLRKYTSNQVVHALVYFNRQAAVQAAATEFRYTDLHLMIERIPVNEQVKIDAKNADTVLKKAKNEARRKRVSLWN